MRQLSAGSEGSVNPHLVIVAGENGVGGAPHNYQIQIPGQGDEEIVPTNIHFQEGAVGEVKDINGITNEALLAIVIDRLQGFAKGPYPSRETSLALTKCQEALRWLEHRTKERVGRGVEGKHEA